MLPSNLTIQDRLAKLFFGKKARITTYRQLERLGSNGIPMRNALETLWDRASDDGRSPNALSAIIFSHWIRNYKDSGKLSDATLGWVPPSEHMMIEAGEVSGQLNTALANVVFVAQNTGRIRSAVISGLAYPVFLMFALAGVLWLFGVRVIPAFSQVLPPEKWTGLAAQMRWMSMFVQTWGLPVVALIIMLVFAYIISLPMWTGRLRVFLDRFPPWSLYRMWNGTGFLLSLSAMVTAGIPLPKALSRLRQFSGRWLAQRIEGALYYVNSGHNLGEALSRTGFGFPDKAIIADLKVYASLSGFEEAIKLIAREWIEEGVAKVQAQSRYLFIAMLVFLAGTIAWVATGFYELQQQVSNAVMF